VYVALTEPIVVPEGQGNPTVTTTSLRKVSRQHFCRRLALRIQFKNPSRCKDVIVFPARKPCAKLVSNRVDSIHRLFEGVDRYAALDDYVGWCRRYA